METKTKAVTIRTIDHKDNDKILWLYSLELGRISIVAKGIKKGNAKLKFAGEPFCFAEFDLIETSNRFVLKTASQIESFYAIREDFDRYLAGCVVLETLALTEEENPNTEMFLLTLNTLKTLTTEEEPNKLLIKYLLGYLKIAGILPTLASCSVCQKSPSKVYIDFERSGAVCEDCRSLNSILLSKSTVAVLQLIDGAKMDKLQNLNIPNHQLKECLQVLSTYFAHTVGKLKSLVELLKIS